MSKVVREDIDSLHAVLSFTLSKEDYSDKFKKELETYRKKVNLKGFRKGKTPMSFVRKMYGQGVLAETVTGMLQNEVSKYLEENKIDILGQPIPVEDHPEIEFDINNPGDYEYKVEIGLVPEVEVAG